MIWVLANKLFNAFDLFMLLSNWSYGVNSSVDVNGSSFWSDCDCVCIRIKRDGIRRWWCKLFYTVISAHAAWLFHYHLGGWPKFFMAIFFCESSLIVTQIFPSFALPLSLSLKLTYTQNRPPCLRVFNAAHTLTKGWKCQTIHSYSVQFGFVHFPLKFGFSFSEFSWFFVHNSIIIWVLISINNNIALEAKRRNGGNSVAYVNWLSK